jgi:hypothetical protein
MGFFDGLKAKMAAGAGAEQGLSMLANEIRSVIGEVGWMLKDGKEVDLRNSPEPNTPANAQNATKKFTYNFQNYQQTIVSLNLYSVWMSMTATDCVLFAYINGASVKTFRFADYIQLYNNQPGVINRDRLMMEVRDMIAAFGSLTPPPPVQQQVMMAPQPMMVVTAPQPMMVVTAPAPQQTVVTATQPHQVTMQPQQNPAYAPQPQTVTGPPQQMTIQMPAMTVYAPNPNEPYAPQPQIMGPPPQQATMQPQQNQAYAPQPQVMGPPQQQVTMQPQQNPAYAPQPQVMGPPQQQPAMQGYHQQVSVSAPGPATACPFCGAGLPQGTGRCPGCGAQFEVRGSMQAQQMQSSSTTVMAPGMTMQTNMPPGVPNFCGRCGGGVDPARRMCTKCGMMY